MNLQRFAFSSVCILGLGTAALAQQPSVTPSQREEATKNPSTSGKVQNDQAEQGRKTAGQDSKSSANSDSAKSKEKLIAECIVLANHEEVALGKLVQERSQNPAVKDFAKMMVEDHQSMLEKLQLIIPDTSKAGFFKDSKSNASDSTSRNATQDGKQASKEGQETIREVAGQRDDNQQKQNRIENQRDGNRTGNAAPAQQGLVQDVSQLHRELAEQCLADSKSMLSEKEGNELDQCYVGMQIVKHAGMLSNLTVFQRHASGELEQIISQGMETTKKHLKHAESLVDQLDGTKSAAKSARVQDRK